MEATREPMSKAMTTARMRIGIPVAMAIHSPGFVALVDTARKQVRECTIVELKARMDAGGVPGPGVILVDVREESEWAKDHLPGAIHIGKGVIERDIEAKVPDPATPLVLYCGGGFRSALAADAIQKMGYPNVVSMDGGWRAWTEKGLPVEK